MSHRDWAAMSIGDLMREGERAEQRWTPAKRAALTRGHSPAGNQEYLWTQPNVKDTLDGGGWDGPGEEAQAREAGPLRSVTDTAIQLGA